MKQISHFLGTRRVIGKDGRDRLQRGIRKCLGVMNMCIILIVVIFFPWECTFAKIYLIVPFKHVELIVRSLYLKVNTSMSKY